MEEKKYGSIQIGDESFKLNAQPSPLDLRDYIAEAIFSAEVDLPEVYDPRKKMFPVRNQGGQGSCVAQSCAALKELQELKNTGFEYYFSPQFVYNNRCNQEGEGMYPRDAMKILNKKGIVPDDKYEYGKIEFPDQINPEIYQEALNYIIKEYALVNTIDGLKRAVYKHGACMFTSSVYSSGGNRYWKPKNPEDRIFGGHAVACIGWNKEGFILRNSWGENFGDNGYCIFPYEDWGLQSEVWTAVDDESSKPDKKYSKWYWKLWRYIKNIKKKMVTLSYVLLIMSSVCVVAGFFEWQFWVFSFVLLLIVIFRLFIGKKMYLP